MQHAENSSFRKILHLAIRHDKTLFSRFLNDNILTRYTNENIQNESLVTLADMDRDQILDEVKTDKYSSRIVDESKDISKKEKIAIVLRFSITMQF